MAHLRGLLDFRTDHHAGRVAEREDRNVEGVAELHESRRLVAAIGVDRASEVARIVGDEAEGRCLRRAINAVIMPTPNAGRSSRTEPVSASVSMPADVVGAQAVLRERRDAADAGRRRPSRCPAIEVAEVCLATATASASSSTAISMTPFDTCTRSVRYPPGRKTPRPPPSIIAGTAHADVGRLVGDHHVATAEQRGIAGETAAGNRSNDRHLAVERAEARKCRGLKACRRRPFVARPSAAAFGEQDDRHRPFVGERQQPVFLLVVDHTLRACEYRVVIAHDSAARPILAEQRAIYRTDTGDHAVGGTHAAQFVRGAALPLRRERKPAIFDEGTGITEIVDIFTRRPLIGLATARNGVRPVLVEQFRASRQRLGEIAADMIQIDRLHRLSARIRVVGRNDMQHGLAFEDRVAGRDQHFFDDFADRRRHRCSIFMASITSTCCPA